MSRACLTFFLYLTVSQYGDCAERVDIRDPSHKGCRLRAHLIREAGAKYVVSDIPGVESAILRTNRALAPQGESGDRDSLESYYPPEMLNDFQDKIVVDIGCGGGKFVKGLLNGWGVDLYLTKKQRKDDRFIRAVSWDLPFRSGTVQRAYATASFLTYADLGSVEGRGVVRKTIEEVYRTLQPDGRFRISPIGVDPELGFDDLKILRELKGDFDMHYVRIPRHFPNSQTIFYAVELRK